MNRCRTNSLLDETASMAAVDSSVQLTIKQHKPSPYRALPTTLVTLAAWLSARHAHACEPRTAPTALQYP